MSKDFHNNTFNSCGEPMQKVQKKTCGSGTRTVIIIGLIR